jgi:hypothetical protein
MPSDASGGAAHLYRFGSPLSGDTDRFDAYDAYGPSSTDDYGGAGTYSPSSGSGGSGSGRMGGSLGSMGGGGGILNSGMNGGGGGAGGAGSQFCPCRASPGMGHAYISLSQVLQSTLAAARTYVGGAGVHGPGSGCVLYRRIGELASLMQ